MVRSENPLNGVRTVTRVLVIDHLASDDVYDYILVVVRKDKMNPLLLNERVAWGTLYRVGGLSALIAAVLEIGAVFISIIFARAVPGPPPGAVVQWFTLLHDYRFVGLTYLGILDLAIALISMMFPALCVALRRGHTTSMAVAAALAFLGIAVYLATSTVVPMVSLSDQYAAATTDPKRSLLVAAGHAVLAVGGVGTGAYMSFLLMGVAGLVISVVMLRTSIFSRAAAYVGILANVAMLAYYVVPLVAPSAGVLFLWISGLLFLIWMILVGYRLVTYAPLPVFFTGATPGRVA